jgi:hypothetical protein
VDRDTEIKKGLSSAGIPKSAWGTTLPKLGQESLRKAIQDKVFFADDPRGAWVYADPRHANHARQVFYVLAKEMFLTGTTVHCVSLLPFSNMLADDGEIPETIERCKMLFILDFYEAGCACPYNDEIAARLRYWIRARFEQGMAVSFLSDSPIALAEWWPTSMLNFIEARVTEYNVGAV